MRFDTLMPLDSFIHLFKSSSGLLPGSAHLNLGYEDNSCVLDIAKYVLTYLGVTRDPVPGDIINSVKESDSGEEYRRCLS